MFYKFNLLLFTFVEILASKLLTILFFIYQASLSSSLIYEIIILKSYFTIVDLYMRYVLLNKF